MAERSIIEAVQARYAGLGFAGKPADLWYGDPPVKRADGTAVQLPLAQLYDDGGSTEAVGGLYDLIRQRMRIEVYVESMTAAKTIELGLKYNGGAHDGGVGFHFADGLPFDASILFMAMYMTDESQFEFQPDRSAGANRVYLLTMKFVVEAMFRG